MQRRLCEWFHLEYLSGAVQPEAAPMSQFTGLPQAGSAGRLGEDSNVGEDTGAQRSSEQVDRAGSQRAWRPRPIRGARVIVGNSR